MLELQGVGVLVTRPEHQAMPLCRLLEERGAVAVRLPAIRIEPAGDVLELARRLRAQAPFELVIFTSANAVRFGAALLEGRRAHALAAIGPATARALEGAGHPVTVLPDGGFDSEHLLAHPQLAQLGGRRALIVTGRHGRGLLQEELNRRGAQVAIAEVYQREPARHEAARLAAVTAGFAAGEIQIVTATSAEIAASLLDAATAALRREFERAHWLVPGARVAAALRQRGLEAPLVQAASAEDQDLLAAVIRWRDGASGA